MDRIKFAIEGELPPKKRGKKSMWGHHTEAPRLLALRTEAAKAFDSRGPFSGSIRLTLRIEIGREDQRKAGDQGTGDLDSFITGVFDGLMAAHPNLLAAKTWHTCFPENSAADPCKAIAYKDDQQVKEIHASVVDSKRNESRYEVELEDLPPRAGSEST